MEILAADISYLLDHTKRLPGVAKLTEAPLIMECQERLGCFVELIKGALR